MPRTAEQNSEIRRERHQAILEAAITLFARNGFSETGISDIARAAGVSHGTIFRYFPSKEELFRSAVMEPVQIVDRAMAGPPIEGTPLERIRHMVRRQVEFIARHREYLAFSERFGGALVPLIREGQDGGELAPGDPAAIAICYFAFLNGAGLISAGDDMDSPFWKAVVTIGVRMFGPVDLSTEE
jgi:TetR/AcrR family transcriptional repressor of mexJK operon